MRSGRKIKVLVVDDSLVFRETIAKGIGTDPSIEVIATAADPFAARDRILEYEPDVMTLDVEMPKMGGIEFLRKLMPQYPLPVVVVSAVNQSVFDAIKHGAVDFVTKPSMDGAVNIQSFINELIIKIKIASTAKVGHWKNFKELKSTAGSIRNSKNRLIALGSSTGGTEAVLNILKSFSTDMPCALVVQHMPPVFTKLYAERLNSICSIEVREAKDGDWIHPGLALIAPGEHHMSVRKDAGGFCVQCYKGEKVSGHCPSVDVLFSSVADCFGSDAVGVILTGMGYDGAKGLLEMRKKGSRTIGQSEETCVVYGMPKAAYDIGAVEKQERLEEIPQLILKYLLRKEARPDT